MAARTRPVRSGQQAGRFHGRDPRSQPINTPIAGNPPRNILDSTLGDPAREKGERMHPLGFSFAVRQPSKPPPSNPFVANFPMLSNSVRGLGLSAATERRLQTLPVQVQDAFRDAIAQAQEPQTDESYSRIMDSYNVLSTTPGAPSFEDLAPLARALEATQMDPRFGEGTDAEIEAATGEPIDLSVHELIIPTQSAEPYAPAEDFFEQETGGE